MFRVLKEEKRVYDRSHNWSDGESLSVLRCSQGFWPDIMLGGEAYLRHGLVTLPFLEYCLHPQRIFGLTSDYTMFP